MVPVLKRDVEPLRDALDRADLLGVSPYWYKHRRAEQLETARAKRAGEREVAAA